MWSVLVLSLFVQQVGENGIMSVDSSYVAGERIDFALTQADLEAAPRWIEILDDPPLAPRQAIRAAERRLGELVDHASRWRLSSVTLRRVLSDDIWIYVVEFGAPFPEALFSDRPIAGGGAVQQIRVPLLMNRDTVTPTRMPWSPRW
jgi:hypothetical protein